jgi:hypothetical protein
MLARKPLILLCGIVFCVGLAVSQGQPAAKPLSGDDIVTRLLDSNARRAESLRAYQGIRVYEVDYKGFPTGHKHAQMTVRAEFHYPHQKTITIVSESGSKTLLNHVLHRLIAVEQETSSEKEHSGAEMNRTNYRFEYLGVDRSPGRDCYLLRVIPARDDKLLYDGKIWVDATDFAIVKIEAQPAKSPSFWISQTQIEHQYGKVGNFWLPFRNRSTSRVRMGGQASLSIEYQDYEITAEQQSQLVQVLGGE